MKKIVFIAFIMVIIFTGCTSQYEDVTDPLEKKIIESFDVRGVDNISYEIADGNMNINLDTNAHFKDPVDTIIPITNTLKDIQELNDKDIDYIRYNFKEEGTDNFTMITFNNEEVMQMDFDKLSYSDIMQYSSTTTNNIKLRN